ncbi:hypothetical protein N5D10_11130 [Citrobacter freundii]|uniref:hypothetical protein n=1 Tax=Citrobacter freundii TaxID=546 RepID=UPI00244CF168|nr:hypothetical protein [Citrobacter freundii]MDH0783767.1 hypothetical protein [Citrobacter freundii]HCL6004049.1 hypothetical protein [Citrobacter freundii]HED2398393.1 hypothetical protein [Citrobacter freundii]
MQTLYGWQWATIWAAVSAVFSMVTVGVAIWAMFRWRKQDELKAKLAFKAEIAKYRHYLRVLSSEHSKKYDGHEGNAERLILLENAFHDCQKAWVLTEGIIDGPVAKHWQSIALNHYKFFKGEVHTLELIDSCELILKEKFVFK